MQSPWDGLQTVTVLGNAHDSGQMQQRLGADYAVHQVQFDRRMCDSLRQSLDVGVGGRNKNANDRCVIDSAH